MYTCPLVQFVDLLATMAAFDVWERRHDCTTRGEGKGTDEMDMDRQRTVGGLLHAHQDHNFAAATALKWLNSSQMEQMSVAAAVGCWRAERQRIIFHFINGRLSSRCPGSQRTAQTLTVCAPFSIIVWVFSYPDIGSKIRYPDFRISINNRHRKTLAC